MAESVKERIERHNSILAELKKKRLPHETGWRDLSRFLLPAHGLYDSEKPGERSPRKLESLDSRPRKNLSNFAAMMHSGHTSPARPWFKITTEDPDLMDFAPVRDWVSFVEKLFYQAYRKSNFYASVHTGYIELAGFGVQAMLQEESWESILHFATQTIGTYWIAQNHQGVVDTLYRKFSMTARQMAARFGKDNLSSHAKSALDNKQDLQEFNVIHAVEPREFYDPRKVDNSNMPFVSCYFEDGENNRELPDNFLREGGYHDFPFRVARWETFGNEVYGTSLGLDVLPDIKQLTAVIRTQTTSIHKELDPPMALASGMKDRLNLMPGTQHPGLLNQQGEPLAKPVYSPNPNLQHGVALRQDIREAITEGFFNDLFLFLIQRPNMTATEVAERHEEKLLLLGPAIERQQSEFFNPLADRTYGILDRNGYIPPPPRELENKELKVEYISLLAQAQKQVGTQAISSTTQFAAGLSQFWPDALDKINPDEAIDAWADLSGSEPKMINTEQQVLEIRQTRAEQKQAAAMNEAMMNAAQAGKTMSETKINPDERTALTDVAAAMGGAQ